MSHTDGASSAKDKALQLHEIVTCVLEHLPTTRDLNRASQTNKLFNLVAKDSSLLRQRRFFEAGSRDVPGWATATGKESQLPWETTTPFRVHPLLENLKYHPGPVYDNLAHFGFRQLPAIAGGWPDFSAGWYVHISSSYQKRLARMDPEGLKTMFLTQPPIKTIKVGFRGKIEREDGVRVSDLVEELKENLLTWAHAPISRADEPDDVWLSSKYDMIIFANEFVEVEVRGVAKDEVEDAVDAAE